VLDHIDLIAGQVHGLIDPSDPGYKNPTVATTRVIARFDALGNSLDINQIQSSAWNDLGDGWKEMIFNYEVKGDSYFRLRGTNQGLGTYNETDGNGNPLSDQILGTNDGAKAFNDLWFYSNPVFVVRQQGTSDDEDNQSDFSVYPNPSTDGYFYVEMAFESANYDVSDMAGKVIKAGVVTQNDNRIDLSDFAKGIYILRLSSNSHMVTIKMIRQ
jgi:hypothetical protein